VVINIPTPQPPLTNVFLPKKIDFVHLNSIRFRGIENQERIELKIPFRSFFISPEFDYTLSFTKSINDSLNGFQKGILQVSKNFLGIKYRYGGYSTNGFDCSGLVRYIYSNVGIEIPHSSREQSQMGETIEKQDAKVGDIIFFGRKKGKSLYINHAGIIVANHSGNIQFIHSSRRGVVIDSDKSSSWNSYYKNRFAFVKRIRV
jgi:hypothetical protein